MWMSGLFLPVRQTDRQTDKKSAESGGGNHVDGAVKNKTEEQGFVIFCTMGQALDVVVVVVVFVVVVVG